MSPALLMPQATYPYETPEFYDCWRRCLAPKFDIRHWQQDWTVSVKKSLKGLLAMKEARIAGWNSAWSQDLTEVRARALQQLSHDWDYGRILWGESRRDRQHFDLLEKAGYRVHHTEHSPLYVADLSQGYENYLKTLSHNGRTNLKKKVRKAQSLNPHLAPVESEADIAPFYEEFFGFHIPYWQEKTGFSYFADPHEREFIVEWSKILFRNKQIKLDRLILGDDVANLCVRLLFGSDAYYLLTINTHAHKDFVPGIVGFAMRIEVGE